MKTQVQLLCNRTFKTHTQDEMQIYNFIRPMKAHTRWNALNKELFCGVNKSNPLSKIKIDLNCEEMRFIKTNLHRILEFAFRNIILENYCLAYSTYSRTSKLPKGILGWASAAECIERAEHNLQKDALRSEGNMTAALHSHALLVTYFK